MRAVLLAALLLSACDDDSTSNGAIDMSAGGDDLASGGGGDLAGGDMACVYKSFTGFPPNGTAQTYFACPCGCSIDTFENAAVLPLWGASTMDATWVPSTAGLGATLTSSNGALAQAGLASEGSPTSRFYLDGDFDVRVEYDLGSTAPPGLARMILGTRKPQTLSGTPQYDLQREQLADGTNEYSSMLGGVPPVLVSTSDTRGVLRMKRTGFTVTTYAGTAGTTQVTTLIAQEAGRLVLTLNASLGGCTVSDLGMTCSYTPRWHKLELISGTLANLPQ